MNSPRHRTKRRTRHLAPPAGALLMALVTPATGGAPWQARLVPPRSAGFVTLRR